MTIHTATEHFTQPLYLSSGRILEPFCVAYETYGELNAEKSNVVLVCHALTGSRHATGLYKNDTKPGWWDKMIGDGKAIDTRRFFVICASVIGAPGGSTCPRSPRLPDAAPYRLKFPVITIADMVRAQIALLARLNIHKIHAVIGGSMGGMQALQLCVDYPNFAKKAFVISAPAATSAQIIAINRIMSEAIFSDPAFENGNYDLESPREFKGLGVARMLGFTQYLSPETLQARFGRDYVASDGYYELLGRFEVERYLQYNGAAFATSYDPLCYLYILKALSNFDISQGFGDVREALSRVCAEVYCVAFSGDNMFPPAQTREIYEVLRDLGRQATYKEIASDYGHDSFLMEVSKYDAFIKEWLGE